MSDVGFGISDIFIVGNAAVLENIKYPHPYLYFNMTNKDLKERTFSFALRILKLGKSTQWSDVDRILIRQLMRSATSVGANYRAALRAKSKKDFLYKINIVEEEADECYFWLKLIAKAEILQEKKLQLLLNEANELTAIFTAQGRTTKQALAKSKHASV